MIRDTTAVYDWRVKIVCSWNGGFCSGIELSSKGCCRSEFIVERTILIMSHFFSQEMQRFCGQTERGTGIIYRATLLQFPLNKQFLR